jgi:hypothetical protein
MSTSSTNAQPYSPVGTAILVRTGRRALPYRVSCSTADRTVAIGLVADSGCGKSTFIRRLTSVFGDPAEPPRVGNPDSNTLSSDATTVISLNDYHSLDRAGRKAKGVGDGPEGQRLRAHVRAGEGHQGGPRRRKARVQPRHRPARPAGGHHATEDPRPRGAAPNVTTAVASLCLLFSSNLSEMHCWIRDDLLLFQV